MNMECKFNTDPEMAENLQLPINCSSCLWKQMKKITKQDWDLGTPSKLWLICIKWKKSNHWLKTARVVVPIIIISITNWKVTLKDCLQARKNQPFGILGRDNIS